MRAQSSPSLVELHSMRARAISLSLSLSYSAAAAIAENMRNQAQSPKVQHVLTSPTLSSLLFTLFSLLSSLSIRAAQTSNQNRRHTECKARSSGRSGGEQEGKR